MRRLTNFLLFFLITTGFSLTSCNLKTINNQEQVIRTTSGDVSGSFNDSVFAFLGIPYAKAERFMPPQDPDVWDGVLECKDFGPVARQIVPWYPDSIQNEKELFSVNVWTQGIKDGKKRPVML